MYTEKELENLSKKQQFRGIFRDKYKAYMVVTSNFLKKQEHKLYLELVDPRSAGYEENVDTDHLPILELKLEDQKKLMVILQKNLAKYGQDV